MDPRPLALSCDLLGKLRCSQATSLLRMCQAFLGPFKRCCHLEEESRWVLP